MEVEEMNLKIPGWLTALIHANFLKRKGNNVDDYKYYCVDCASKSLTAKERFTEHGDHNVLEPLKCSWYHGYRVDDIKGLKDNYIVGAGLDLDIVSGVARFTINGSFIFYPKSRRALGLYVESHGVTNCCFTCGFRLMIKGDKTYNFCSILCKLLYEARDDRVMYDALIAPLKKNHHQDRVFEREEEKVKEKSNALLLKFKVGANSGTDLIKEVKEKEKNEERRSGVLLKSKLGVNGGGIKKPVMNKGKEIAAYAAAGSSIMEEIEVINGDNKMVKEGQKKQQQKKKPKKMIKKKNDNKADNDEKLQSLISVVMNNHHVKLQGFRKRSRKGIPCRSPFS